MNVSPASTRESGDVRWTIRALVFQVGVYSSNYKFRLFTAFLSS